MAKLKRRSTLSPDVGRDPGGGTSSPPAVKPTPEKTPPPTKPKPRPMSGAYGFGADEAGFQPSSPAAGMGPLSEVSAGAGLAGAMNSNAGLNTEFASARAATLQSRAVKLGANGNPAAADASGAADLLTAAGLQL